ncbi:MAG: DUF177 domain-containing protein [Clostridiales bacterium]|nr:DUF177 domain-containing protein [Clostridiales bacterium]
MKIDIQPIISGIADHIDIGCDIETPPEAAPDDVEFTSAAHVSGSLSGDVRSMMLKCGIKVGYKTHCARCFRDVEGTFETEIFKPVALKGTLDNEEDDEYLIADKAALDLYIPVNDAIILDFPMRVLCRDDCRGLCPVCGKDLNEGGCACDTREIDPRLEVLRQLLVDKEGNDGGETNQTD